MLDISEGGLRYQSGPYPTPNIGTSFRGTVRVRRGELIHTHSNVVRTINGEVAARLVVGIPFQTIMKQAARVRAIRRSGRLDLAARNGDVLCAREES